MNKFKIVLFILFFTTTESMAVDSASLQKAGFSPDLVYYQAVRVQRIRTSLLSSAFILGKDPNVKSKYKFVLDCKNRGLHAFANNKNQVVISYDLTNYFKDDNQLAFILAHEIAHLHLGHAKMDIKPILLSSVVSAGVNAILQHEGVAKGAASAAGKLSGNATNKAFSRAHEEAADKFAVQMMAEAKLNPHAASIAMQNLLNAKKQFYIPFFNTHPAGDYRVAYLREEAQKWTV